MQSVLNITESRFGMDFDAKEGRNAMNRYLVKIDFHNGTSAQEEFEAGNKLQAHRKAYKKYKGQYLASTILQIVQEDAETTGRKEGVTTKVFIREIEKGVPLYRDSRTGIAWAEDHRTGLCISVHPNIDESGSVEGMVARGRWRRDDRIEKSHGWIYNTDRLAYDANDPVEKAVADACMCRACQERRVNAGRGAI